MTSLHSILDHRLFDNSLLSWLLALATALGVVLAVSLLRRFLGARAKTLAARTRSRADDLVLNILGRTRAWFITLLAVFVGCRALTLDGRVERGLDVLLTLGLALQVGLWANVALSGLFENYRRRHMADAGVTTAISVMAFIGHVLVWSILLLAALDNLGVNVTAMVAGLGVGGIAVALAVQNILGDLFASVSIILDRPFVIGDFIVVGDFMGTVEHIGLKTTKVRSLGGEQLVFPNNDLLKDRIRNFKRMAERRVVFTLGIDYATTPDQLEWLIQYVRELITREGQLRLERAHFFKFGESSLDIEVAYWVKSPDYAVYMDLQQRMNLDLMRAMAERGIQFAYPTRTVKFDLQTPSAPDPREVAAIAGQPREITSPPTRRQ